MITRINNDESGAKILILPDALCSKFDVEIGDDLTLAQLPNGELKIYKVKKK
jgi:antitoxin component of MazEF toxin-antitoxin module